MVAPYPIICPHCASTKFINVGIGIQRVESDLVRILGDDYSFLRIDSDNRTRHRDIMTALHTTDIILATSRANTLSHPDISLVIFLAFELNLSIPDYDIEEQIYTEIAYYKKQSLSIAIQTYTPDHPLLSSVV
jgi:primosomal protein N'